MHALRRLGYHDARRKVLSGNKDQGDVHVTDGITAEVKGGEAARSASDNQIRQWLAEAERERVNSASDFCLLVLQRRGVGPANADRWWAVIRSDDLGRLCNFEAPPGLVLRTTLAEFVQILRSTSYTPTNQRET